MTGTAHPGSLNQIEALEQKKAIGAPGHGLPDESISRERPNFANELRNSEVYEGRAVHFESKLTPITDPNLRIEWLHNGKPLQTGMHICRFGIK